MKVRHDNDDKCNYYLPYQNRDRGTQKNEV